LSDSPEPALALQGVSWLTRKAVALAGVTLQVREYEGPPTPPNDAQQPVTHIEIEQSVTGGLTGTSEKRCLDFRLRDHTDWLFGHVRGRSRWITAADISDDFLKNGWLEDGGEKCGPAGETHILSHVESADNGWTATQIWGFQTVDGARRYCRNIVVAKGDEKIEFRLVYDYQS
jgi:hypothetical protein